jgi:hypothetical protein
MNGWLERFGASDAEEEEVVDLNGAFRALLGEKKSPSPKAADTPATPQPRERHPRHRA